MDDSTASRLPDDTVFFNIFPDFSLPSKTLNPQLKASLLQSLHLDIVNFLSPFTSTYIWQHEPFSLSLSSSPISHLQGKLKYGDNLEDEWFVVYLLFQVSFKFSDISVRVWDTDGEFLLIEAAFHLPRWVNPENSENRVFIRRGDVYIIPRSKFPETPGLIDSLLYFVDENDNMSRAADSVQLAIKNRILEYPKRAERNMHCVRARVLVSVAMVLKHEPCFISLAVEGFYDRDIDTMKYAAKMERFLSKGREQDLVTVLVRMSRAMYGQLVQQTFQAPKCYPAMPPGSDTVAYAEADLGMKISCGLEMIYQLRKKQGNDGRGSTWDAFRESLEKSGYFDNLLPGSKENKRLMETAEEYYKKSSLFSRASEMMSAPVRRIDEILSLPHLEDEFKVLQLPPSDNDSWLYNGEDELNSALEARQKEIDCYSMRQKRKEELKVPQDAGPSSVTDLEDFDLGNITKMMQSFVQKISTYEGAEVPENRSTQEVHIDADSFLKEIESIMRPSNHQETACDDDLGEASSSEMDFDASEYESDMSEDKEGGEDNFLDSYADVLNKELMTTTVNRTFVRANEKPSNPNEEISKGSEDMNEDFNPVDVDVNLVKSLLDSFSSQQGLPGPASNLLGLMGVNLPKDNKSKGN